MNRLTGSHCIAARFAVLAGFTTGLTCGFAHAQRVIYVRQGAAGSNDGASWADAYMDLQDALDDARAAGNADAEIWIAAGVYKPDRGTGDPHLAFELFGNIGLYGGFSGHESRRADRDVNANSTTLSGDLSGDDDLSAIPTADCCTLATLGSCGDAGCRETVAALDGACPRRWDPHCSGFAVLVCCHLCQPTRCDNS